MKTRLILGISFLIALISCASKEEKMKDELNESIVQYLNESKMGWFGITNISFPYEHKESTWGIKRIKGMLDFLSSKGLVKVTDSVSDGKVITMKYDLTEYGKKISFEESKDALFLGKQKSTMFKCFGFKFDGIVFYSEPSSGPNGVTVTNVKYRVKNYFAENWCNDPKAKQIFNIDKYTENEIDTNRITLFKSSEGWLPISKM